MSDQKEDKTLKEELEEELHQHHIFLQVLGRLSPDDLVDVVVEAAEECPGECIMIEPYDAAVMAAREN